MTRPLWRDYSRYDDVVHFDVAKANGVQGFASRCTMGWSGVDDTFQERWIQGGDVGIYRTSYSVLYPSLNVEQQMDWWFQHHPQIDIIPRVIDAEVQDGQTDARVGEVIWEACELIKAHDGVYPIVYSRYLLLNAWLEYWSQGMIDSMYYWGARYLWDRTNEHPGPPYSEPCVIPPDRWILHQTADKKPPFPGETERSSIVDWDRWMIGDEVEMHQFIADTWGGEVDPPDDPPVEPPELVARVEALEEVILLHQIDLDNYEARIAILENTVYGHGDRLDLQTETIALAFDDRQDHEIRIIALEQAEPPDPPDEPDVIMVQATDTVALHVVVEHDKACDNQDPPGKPILEPPPTDRIVYNPGDVFTVDATAYYSCKDDPDTPTIKATGGVLFYIVAEGESGAGQFARADKVVRV